MPEQNALARQFTLPSLMRFALPNIIMMVFLSMYTIVDGMFISRYVGTLALSAVNMTYPLNCLEMASCSPRAAARSSRGSWAKGRRKKRGTTFLSC